MKNPFVMMALAAAAMFAQTRQENAASVGVRLAKGSRLRQPGKPNPAGSKMLRHWHRNATGFRGTYSEAREWYGKLQEHRPA